MKKALFFALALMAGIALQAQEYRFNSEPNGFSISNKNDSQLTFHHNLGAVTIEDANRAEVQGQVITLSGIYLSNAAGTQTCRVAALLSPFPMGQHLR